MIPDFAVTQVGLVICGRLSLNKLNPKNQK